MSCSSGGDPEASGLAPNGAVPLSRTEDIKLDSVKIGTPMIPHLGLIAFLCIKSFQFATAAEDVCVHDHQQPSIVVNDWKFECQLLFLPALLFVNTLPAIAEVHESSFDYARVLCCDIYNPFSYRARRFCFSTRSARQAAEQRQSTAEAQPQSVHGIRFLCSI